MACNFAIIMLYKKIVFNDENSKARHAIEYLDMIQI